MPDKSNHPVIFLQELKQRRVLRVIIGLIVLNIIPRKEKEEILNISIAVIPFIYDSSLVNLKTIRSLKI
jgi:hypothetical protein